MSGSILVLVFVLRGEAQTRELQCCMRSTLLAPGSTTDDSSIWRISAGFSQLMTQNCGIREFYFGVCYTVSKERGHSHEGIDHFLQVCFR